VWIGRHKELGAGISAGLDGLPADNRRPADFQRFRAKADDVAEIDRLEELDLVHRASELQLDREVASKCAGAVRRRWRHEVWHHHRL